MQRLEPIPFGNVTLDDGFWANRQKINREATIPAIYNRFSETGRFDALRFDWKPGDPNRPHVFWDSDIAKWIEAACMILRKRPDGALSLLVEGMIDLMERHQDPSGYFNIWFTVGEPDMRWKRRTDHELYCAGHLIEAAVSHREATGSDRFLRFAMRLADHIEAVFVKDRSAAFVTPGHEEIELALVRLYRATGERRYLELSKFFIDHRGEDDPAHYYDFANARYAQDHLPVRRQSTAEGHAVRATYLYAAMADVALETSDGELLEACRRLFDDIVNRKMYITGGIGSSCVGEAFTIEYDLPNLTAYTESCAAIGLMIFAGRMLQHGADGRYADAVERVLYNGFLSGVSLDGCAFFYENPLEIDPRLHNRDISIERGKSRFPAMRRSAMFSCACCPPNIARFISGLGGMLYSHDGNTLYVHHYAASSAAFEMGGAAVSVAQHTRYPSDGNVSIAARGLRGKRLALRIPGWCGRYALRAGGSAVEARPVMGYAYLDCAEDAVEIEVSFQMEPVLVEAHPCVQDDAGRVALMRGPVVYCLEETDNGKCLRDVAVDPDTAWSVSFDPLFGVCVIEADGSRRNPDDFTGLYRAAPAPRERVRLRFIPYFAFANRSEGEMIVWVQARRPGCGQ